MHGLKVTYKGLAPAINHYTELCVLGKISTPNALIFFQQIGLIVPHLWSSSGTRFDVFSLPQVCRLSCNQHVSDTPIYKFDLLILNIIT